MKVTVSKVASRVMPQLQTLTDDPRCLSAWSSELGVDIPAGSDKIVHISRDLDLQVSSKPPEVILAAPTSITVLNWETAKILAQDLFIPMIELIDPRVGRLVRGVNFFFALGDLVATISDDMKDITESEIKAARAAQKGVDLLLSFTNAPPLATKINTAAGILLTTASGLYAVQVKQASTTT